MDKEQDRPGLAALRDGAEVDIVKDRIAGRRQLLWERRGRRGWRRPDREDD